MWEFAMEHYITFFFCFYIMCLLLEVLLKCVVILVRGYPNNNVDIDNMFRKDSSLSVNPSCRYKDCDKCEKRHYCNPNVGEDEP